MSLWGLTMINWRAAKGHLALMSILVMSSCGPTASAPGDSANSAPAGDVSASSEVESEAPAEGALVDASAQQFKVAPEPGEPPTTSPPTTTTPLLLAYSYRATLSLPAEKVIGSMKVHEQKCITAGAALCQIVSASSQIDGDNASAILSLRATPTWLGTFRAGLEQDAKTFDGKLRAQGVTSEDLTRNITDSEARLRAQKALRTRIEALINSRPGKLADLLEAERELARVQGEIDSFESNLSVMRARVNMSTMELAYQSRQIAVGEGTFKPLGRALTGFFGVMASSLATLITFLAAILPFVLVLGPLGYFGLKWRAGRAKAKTPKIG
jgi:hypothetical protein